jgi:hypothetical protein
MSTKFLGDSPRPRQGLLPDLTVLSARGAVSMPSSAQRVQSFSGALRALFLHQNLERSSQSMRHDHFARANVQA